jgi:hypothetical protein
MRPYNIGECKWKSGTCTIGRNRTILAEGAIHHIKMNCLHSLKLKFFQPRNNKSAANCKPFLDPSGHSYRRNEADATIKNVTIASNETRAAELPVGNDVGITDGLPVGDIDGLFVGLSVLLVGSSVTGNVGEVVVGVPVGDAIGE